MRRHSLVTLLALTLVAGLMLGPGTAFAASAAATPTPLPAPAGAGSPASNLEIQLWPSESDGSSVLVSAEIPADAKLPYTLRLPMPVGISVTWCGEIIGTDVNQDKEVAYTIEEGQGGKALVMTLSTSRVGQYEGTMPAPVQSGGRSSTTFEWIQSAPAGGEDFAVKLTNAVSSPTFDPAAAGPPQQNSSGERLYAFAPQQLALGSTFKLAVSWTMGAGPGAVAPAASGGAFDVVLVVLVIALAAAVVALVVVAGRVKRGATAEDVEQDASAPGPSLRRGAPREDVPPPPPADEVSEDRPDSDDPFDALD